MKKENKIFIKNLIILLICITILIIGVIGQIKIYHEELLNQIKLYGFYKSDITTLDLYKYNLISITCIITGTLSSVACIIYYLSSLTDKK